MAAEKLVIGRSNGSESQDSGEGNRGASRSALCFSGGGVRSAAISLGVARGLARRQKLLGFDYLSVVSGGAFSGGMITKWISDLRQQDHNDYQIQEKIAAVGGFSEMPLVQLRRYSNYLTPRLGAFSLDSLTGALIYVRNIIINILLLLPFYLSIILIMLIIFNMPLIIKDNNTSKVLLVVAIFISAIVYSFVLRKAPIGPAKLSKKNNEKIINSPIKTFNFYSIIYFISALLFTLSIYIYLGSKNTIKLEFDQCTVTLSMAGFQTLITGCLPLQITIVSIVIVSACALSVVIDYYKHTIFGGKTVILDSIFDYLWPYLVEAVCISFIIIVVLANPYFFTEPVSNDLSNLQIIVAIGPLVIAVIHVLGQISYFAVTSRKKQYRMQREWLSRFIAAQLRYPIIWMIFAAAVVFADSGITWPGDTLKAVITEWAAPIAAFATIASTIIALVSGRGEPDQRNTQGPIKWLGAVAAQVLLPALVLAAFVMVTALLSNQMKNKLGFSDGIEAFYDAAIWALILIIGGLLFSSWIDVNRFTAHDIYRNRLVRAFLGGLNKDRNADPYTGFDTKDDLMLAELKPKPKEPLPFLIVNLTLNAFASGELAWQERRALPFSASPLAIGSMMLRDDTKSDIFSYTPAGCYRPADKFAAGSPGSPDPVTLGEAIAISGAAFHTAMGSYSNPIRSVILWLLNLRLGVWVGNPANQSTWRNRSPKLAIRPLFVEMLSATSETDSYINVSDGGHFDNLGLYEMLRRKCELVVVIDGGADPDCKLADLGKAIRMAQLDMPGGLTIEFEKDSLAQLRDQQNDKLFAVADIKYHCQSKNNRYRDGKLIYVKPKLTANMPASVLGYAADNTEFPHEPTTDQWFGESQLSAYVELGEYIGAELAPKLSNT